MILILIIIIITQKNSLRNTFHIHIKWTFSYQIDRLDQEKKKAF